MHYWLVKADPDTDYSIDDLARDEHTEWTGVHNFQAIANIKHMESGDLVYFYHSQKQKSIVGLAKVTSDPYQNLQDPRTSWAVQLSFLTKYNKPLQLSTIKENPAMQDFLLVRHTRLSVMPVSLEVHKLLKRACN
jgi:predicted RNA-binding protein with PUA-like domain